MECLFSLEVFIQDISDLSVDCGIPAVAFRFLDYPTLLVYYTDLKNIEDIETKIQSVEMDEGDAMMYLAELRNDLNGYDFNKGKSCLFRKPFQSLQHSLSQVPLYVTLVDCLDKGRVKKQPKLLGVCSVSLLPLTESIKKTKQTSFEDSPAIAFERHSINVCNLMGTRIGTLNFTLKLTCYGSSLLRHVTVEEKKDSHINILLKNLTVDDYLLEDHAKERREISPPLLVEKLPADGVVPAPEVPSLTRVEQKPETKDSSCQVFRKDRRKKMKKVRETDDVEHDNTFRPPPLYLNLYPDDNYSVVGQTKIREEERIKLKSRYLTETNYRGYDDDFGEEFTSDEDPLIEKLVPVKGNRNVYQIKEVEHVVESQRIVAREETAYDGNLNELHNLKNSMPVLCSLVSEIARFDKLINGAKNGRLNVEERDEKKIVCNCKSDDNLRRTSSPIHPMAEEKLNISSHIKSHIRTDQNNIFSETGSPRKEQQSTPRKSKPRSPPQKKRVASPRKLRAQRLERKRPTVRKNTNLSYGLTRTQRLRYAMTHPGEELKNREEETEEELEEEELNVHTELTRVPSPIPDEQVADRKEELCDERQPVLEKGIQTSIEKIHHHSTIDTQDHLPAERRQTESAVGFYSPMQPREVSLDDLFDDNHPWSSVSTNQNSPSQYPTNHSRDEGSYSDDSFLSGSAISATSSISLPPVSNVSGHSSPQTKMDNTLRSVSMKSFVSPQRRSVVRTPTQTTTESHSDGRSSHSSSSSRASSNQSNSDKTHSHSTIRSRVSNRASPDVPKQSVYSPIKSSYRRVNSEEQTKNVLNVTLPSVTSLTSDTYTNSFNSDYNP